MYSPLYVVSRIKHKLRYGLSTKLLLDQLSRIGIYISPFYLVEERLWEDLAPDFEKGFENFEVVPLGSEEMETISRIPEIRYSTYQLLARLAKGQKCFGVKKQGVLVAFTWVDLLECSSDWRRFPLKTNEAYLSSAYTLEAFRGMGIAPYMRYGCYKALNNLGRDTFYSISEAFNSPAIRFKKRLKARILSFWLYTELFKKYHRTWKLRDYE